MKFEIFKTGTHTSDKGIQKDYSLDDLNFIAQSYKPDEDEAPIVIGLSLIHISEPTRPY